MNTPDWYASQEVLEWADADVEIPYCPTTKLKLDSTLDDTHMALTLDTLSFKCSSCGTADPGLVDVRCKCPTCSLVVCRSCVRALKWETVPDHDLSMEDPDDESGTICGLCAKPLTT